MKKPTDQKVNKQEKIMETPQNDALVTKEDAKAIIDGIQRTSSLSLILPQRTSSIKSRRKATSLRPLILSKRQPKEDILCDSMNIITVSVAWPKSVLS